MRIKRSMQIDIGERADLTALRAMGRQVWRDMQTRVPIVDRRSAPEILRDLKARYGTAPRIAEALGEERGSKGYKASLRQIERQLRGERGIGPEYRERYRRIAPPSIAERLLFRPPRHGQLWMRYEGIVFYPSAPTDYEEYRELEAPMGGSWDDPGQWEFLVQDPLTSFYEGWGGNPFGGQGRLSIYFEGE